MKVTNNAPRREGVHTVSGLVYLGPGETRDLDLTDGGLRLAKRLSFIAIHGAAIADPEAGDGESDALGTESAGGAGNGSTASYAVRDKGRGWFVITLGGLDVTKSLRADDVKDFDAKTIEDKFSFVEANKIEG